MQDSEKQTSTNRKALLRFVLSWRTILKTLFYSALMVSLFELMGNASRPFAETVIFYFFTCVFTFPFVSISAVDRFLAHCMKRTAEEIDFVHLGEAYIDGKIVDIPSGKKRVFGTIASKDNRMRAYLYKRKVGKHHFRFIMFESVLSHNIPNIHIEKAFTWDAATGGIISSKKMVPDGPGPTGLVKLNFEHDFNEHFSVHTEDGLEQEVYEIFTKDFMQLLLAHKSDVDDMRVIGGKLYLPDVISNLDLKLKERLVLFSLFHNSFEEASERIDRSVVAIRETSQKN